MFNKDFFPTPKSLIEKMLEDVDLKDIKNVLEPSAGKGDMVDYILKRNKNLKIDCIEIDENLRYILQGKKYRIVNDDFLTYSTLKSYGLILANFPFSEGDKHLRKALEMLETSGGTLSCLVNAETIKNPYSNIRKDIVNILNKNNATIEYLENEFVNAERKTEVEVALIKCKIKKKKKNSILLEELKKAQEEKESTYTNNYIVTNDFIQAIIKQYEFECSVGVKLIEEYKQLRQFTSSSFEKTFSLLELNLVGDTRNFNENGLKNRYLKKVRYKYWEALFNNKNFTKLFTSNLRQDFFNKLSDLSNYEFNEFNILEIRKQLNNQVSLGVKDTIVNLFEEFSHKHYWDKTNSSNIHYYNGWKSNSCYKINKKVIIPLYAFDSYNGSFYPNRYDCSNKLLDIEKVFNYLDTQKSEELDLREILQKAQLTNQSKNIMTKYFKMDFYKKGTAHLTFLDEELLKKFNIFGAMNKEGWLPPSYGKKAYNDMSEEEKSVIDNFEGEKEYSKVMNNTKYYIYETNNFLLE